MDFSIPEELRMLQLTVRRFIEEELRPLERDYIEEYELPEEIGIPLKKKAQAVGLWALNVPEEYGGGEVNQLGLCLVSEELGKIRVGHEVFGGGVNGILLKAGTEEQKKRWVFPTVNGELRACWCLTEPGAGSDAAELQTAAVRDGDNYVLNGTKTFISGAHKADYAVVVARMKGTQRREGITIFIVPASNPGFKVVREIPMLGRPPGSQELPCEVVFEDCLLSPEYVVGQPGQGWRLMQEQMGGVRLRVGAQAVGIAERCLQMAIDYAKQRVTFREPLSSRQAIQWMLADSAVEIHATRWMVYHGAWKIDQGEDARQEMSMVKLFGANMACQVVDRALQIHGGLGYSKDLVLERYYRDARCMRIVDGTDEMQRFIIARNLLRD